jgi:hypothetical protein
MEVDSDCDFSDYSSDYEPENSPVVKPKVMSQCARPCMRAVCQTVLVPQQCWCESCKCLHLTEHLAAPAGQGQGCSSKASCSQGSCC